MCYAFGMWFWLEATLDLCLVHYSNGATEALHLGATEVSRLGWICYLRYETEKRCCNAFERYKQALHNCDDTFGLKARLLVFGGPHP